MAFDKKGTRTFSEWLIEITRPQRKFYFVTGSDRHILTSEYEFLRQERVFCFQGRSEQSSPFIVLCPQENVKILIQSKGIKNKKLATTWMKSKHR